MAYTSDLRVKNLIKDIDVDVRKNLKAHDLDDKICLRIFDESKEDDKLWKDGGLSFADPETSNKMGSNDAAWETQDGIPLVVVEGTFCTERGSVGDAQLNRFSHTLGVVLNGYVGVMLIPFKGQSFIKKGSKRDILVKNVNYQNGHLNKQLVYGALELIKHDRGEYYCVDPYNEDDLKDLVVQRVLKHYKKENEYEKVCKRIVTQMEDRLGSYIFGGGSRQVLDQLYDAGGQVISNNARMFTQNLAALTTSGKRDDHGLWGKVLIQYLTTDEDIFTIYLRLGENDLITIRARNKKELKFLFGTPRIKVKCFDDLNFIDPTLQSDLENIRNSNLLHSSEKELIKKIQKAFNAGEIRVKA